MLKGETWGRRPLDPEDTERAAMGVELDSTSTDGARVRAVRKNAPAAKAGIEEGDTIVQFAGESIDSSIRLLRRLADMKSGDQASVSVMRGEAVIQFEVILADNRSLSEPPVTNEAEPVGDFPYLGVEVEATPKRKKNGVKIVNVIKGSPADEAGLQKDDLILSVDDSPVESPDHLANLIFERVPDESITILVGRKDGELSIVCKLGRQ